ncbi:translesion DNA synthesis-associated protein ImuA [Pseudoalteromonas xiamenensis]|uniref:translesion DNA synthesis-associated protein ImuA n=1 Tax=Pseudoalteromonas xiamenensis TaxID=882626 RepID=UPI0035E87638
MNKLIDLLTHRHLVWQGNREQPVTETIASGFSEVDSVLAGGFPLQGVIELDTSVGIGELRFLLPSLAKQTRLVAFIHPPAQVNAQALVHAGVAAERVLVIEPKTTQEALWAAEWCAKSGACASVLLWQDDLAIHQIKRLQLAAAGGEAQVWLLRHDIRESLALPWTLSMRLLATEEGLEAMVNKRKGGWSSRTFKVNFQPQWADLVLTPEPSAEIFPFQAMQHAAK